jgi:cytochrome c oxidase subunit II
LFLRKLSVASSASEYPVNIFQPRATPAESVYHLSPLLVLSICATLFTIVAGLPVFTIVNFRRKSNEEREPPPAYGSNRIEVAWTVIPILIVFVLTMATARVVTADQEQAGSERRASSDVGGPSMVVGSPASRGSIHIVFVRF